MTSSWTERATVVRCDAVNQDPRARVEVLTGSWARLADAEDGCAPTPTPALGSAAMVDQARAAGRAQGYARGWAEGRRAAEERGRLEAEEAATQREAEDRRHRQRQAQAHAALTDAIAELRHAVSVTCSHVEQQATMLAFRLVEEILGRELEVAASPGTDAVRRALALLPDEPLVTVRLHPDDLTDEAAAACPEGGRLVADASLQRGDAIVETDAGVVDARLSTALARVREAWQ